MSEEDVLTEDILREAVALGEGPLQRYYYPIHSYMWDSLLEIGWTEKQLADWGFLETTYLEVVIGNKMEVYYE